MSSSWADELRVELRVVRGRGGCRGRYLKGVVSIDTYSRAEMESGYVQRRLTVGGPLWRIYLSSCDLARYYTELGAGVRYGAEEWSNVVL